LNRLKQVRLDLLLGIVPRAGWRHTAIGVDVTHHTRWRLQC
jgi:hypothetical protein